MLTVFSFKPVVFTPPVTYAAVTACIAFFRFFCSAEQKICNLSAAGKFLKRSFSQLSDSPVIQNVKITRVYRTVSLCHKVCTAAAAGSAGAGSIAQKNMYVILKKTNAVIMSFFPVLIPEIKETAKKTADKPEDKKA